MVGATAELRAASPHRCPSRVPQPPTPSAWKHRVARTVQQQLMSAANPLLRVCAWARRSRRAHMAGAWRHCAAHAGDGNEGRCKLPAAPITPVHHSPMPRCRKSDGAMRTSLRRPQISQRFPHAAAGCSRGATLVRMWLSRSWRRRPSSTGGRRGVVDGQQASVTVAGSSSPLPARRRPRRRVRAVVSTAPSCARACAPRDPETGVCH